MLYLSFGDLKQEVLREVDMEGEDFISAPEVKGYFTDAIREACALIHKLGCEDDYFKKSVSYSLTVGLEELSLPADIYAAKIRGLTYATSEKIYAIKRVKGPNKFAIIQGILKRDTTSYSTFIYDLENSDPVTGHKIKLYPKSTEATTNCIVMDYIRRPIALTSDASLVDIPEFYSFIKAFVKYKLYDKEGSPRVSDALNDLNKERELMLATLSEMTPDYDSMITPDLSFYEEMS